MVDNGLCAQEAHGETSRGFGSAHQSSRGGRSGAEPVFPCREGCGQASGLLPFTYLTLKELCQPLVLGQVAFCFGAGLSEWK